MADKNLVNDVINKDMGSMIKVTCWFYWIQIGLLLKTMCNILLCLPLKKQSNFMTIISRIIEKALLGRFCVI